MFMKESTVTIADVLSEQILALVPEQSILNFEPSFNARFLHTTPGLGHQHDLAGILARFQVTMRIGDLIEWKSAIDVGLNPTFGHAAHDLLSPAANLFAFAPHVSEIQAKDSFVPIHQRERVKARHLCYRFQCAEFAPDAGS